MLNSCAHSFEISFCAQVHLFSASIRVAKTRRGPGDHFFQQGRWAKKEAEEFEMMRRRGVSVHFDGDPISDWRHLVRADIMVMAKSSFSHVPALLSSNCVIYEPFWHGKLARCVRACVCAIQHSLVTPFVGNAFLVCP